MELKSEDERIFESGQLYWDLGFGSLKWILVHHRSRQCLADWLAKLVGRKILVDNYQGIFFIGGQNLKGLTENQVTKFSTIRWLIVCTVVNLGTIFLHDSLSATIDFQVVYDLPHNVSCKVYRTSGTR